MTVFENNQKNYCQKADVKRTFFLRDFLRLRIIVFLDYRRRFQI